MRKDLNTKSTKEIVKIHEIENELKQYEKQDDWRNGRFVPTCIFKKVQ